MRQDLNGIGLLPDFIDSFTCNDGCRYEFSRLDLLLGA